MTDAQSHSRSQLSPTDAERFDRICDAFEQAWRAGSAPRIEEYLKQLEERFGEALLAELIAQEVDLRREAGDEITIREYLDRFPTQRAAVQRGFALIADRASEPQQASTGSFLGGEDTVDGHTSPPPVGEVPSTIDRFQVQRLLGAGKFGAVYLAHDPVIDRLVAIKQPLPERIGEIDDVDRYVEEARNAAKLNHPGIVRVHDVRYDGASLFIVQQYVEGRSLAHLLQQERPDARRAAAMMLAVAEALAHAHQEGVVHRDLKPANILIDRRDRPYVADFGLAVHETTQRAHKGERAGSPAYMSPEQVRCETHRLDGRSDIWAVGIMLYELLSDCRPFGGSTRAVLFDEIQYREPRPLRQRDAAIPAEIDRICAKCLEKRMTDRYGSATDLADDLRYFLDSPAPPTRNAGHPQTLEQSARAPSATRIVPRGLRSFEAADADGFLQLLPGPRDRDRLPRTIRFWKTRLEQLDADETFAVGVMYGPSGCGKSSLVKAGLLPQLAEHVVPVYVEATSDDAELRLLKGLRKRVAALPEQMSLPEVLRAVRETGLPDGRKLLLILDQFEQWLHVHSEDLGNQLLQALRQCDGGRVQCLALVREEYAMPCLRFLAQLDLEMREGENFGFVDLFDRNHSEKVLRLFGQAFGVLSEADGDLSPAQEVFLRESIRELSDEKGRIVCVRLALFAEMVKGKPWIPSTLSAVGGAHGLGVTYLEETFSKDTAKPTHRRHCDAATAVLQALLPKSGTGDIKGAMRSYHDLLEASGCAQRPADFETVIRILDQELRLITPTDPAGEEIDKDDGGAPNRAGKYYQLTHDYLVPSLQEWLVRKQGATRRGRAELRLTERSALWNAKRENRNLPKAWEHLNIRLLTRKKDWTEPQCEMMNRSGRYHFGRLTILAILFALAGGTGFETYRYVRGTSLAESIGSAETDELEKLIDDLSGFRHWAHRPLQDLVASDNPGRRLRGSLALLPVDASQVAYLSTRLLDCGVDEFSVVRDSLSPHEGELTPHLWNMLHDLRGDTQQRFHAAMALAQYAPTAAQWNDKDYAFVVTALLSSNPDDQRRLRSYCSPISARLLPHLEDCFDDPSQRDSVRESAAVALADYARGDLPRIAHLASRATGMQHKFLFPLLATRRGAHDTVVTTLSNLASQRASAALTLPKHVQLGKVRAGAAINLLRLGEAEASFRAFVMEDDPESLSQFIHRCRARDVRPRELINALQKAPTVHARFALLLALGDFARGEIPEAGRDALIQQLIADYATDPSSAIHGATGWLLRQWGMGHEVAKVDQTRMPYDESGRRDWYVTEILVPSTDGHPLPPTGQRVTTPNKKIYITFIVFGPGEVRLGAGDTLQCVDIPRQFAVSDREITWEQFDLSDNGHSHQEAEQALSVKLASEEPVCGADWFKAVDYCRWLSQAAKIPESDRCYDPRESLPHDEKGMPANWPMDPDRHGYRLLTEAEWEYVCRSGTRTNYSFGNDRELLKHYAWFVDNASQRSHAGALKRPNGRGLFDVHGNLQEWCHDWRGPDSGSNVRDVGGPPQGKSRRMRGGGYNHEARMCSSIWRDQRVPTNTSVDQGFRIAVVPIARDVSEPGESKSNDR